jgi:hypothetical protein
LDWKEYEREVEAHFRAEYPSARIEHNVLLDGKLSGTKRQIDLLIKAQICDLPIKIVIDAKHRATKIDVKTVEEFLGLVRDVGAHKGITQIWLGFPIQAYMEQSSKHHWDGLWMGGKGQVPWLGFTNVGLVLNKPLGGTNSCT